MRFVAIVCAVALSLVAGLAGCESNPLITSEYDYSDSTSYDYSVGDTLVIAAETFVGAITFDQSGARSVQVTVTRWANRESNLELLQVEAAQAGSQITISVTNPEDLNEVAADIEIVGPAEVVLDLAAGVGRVDCSGEPGASWQADIGVGDVELSLPADVNATVELATGVGSIDVDFEVDGEVSSRLVVGDIGDGGGSEIAAHVGVGDISVDRIQTP